VKTREEHESFYWPAKAEPETWRIFRVANDQDSSRRTITEVSIQEIGAVVLHVLHQAGSAKCGDIARSVCRLLGMGRTPADAEARVMLSIERLARAGNITEVNGIVRLT
jgi:hypothetical protein